MQSPLDSLLMAGDGMATDTGDVGMDSYFSGEKLYGNDFNQDQIHAWFADEAEGYFNLTQSSGDGKYAYGYHTLNRRHGFSQLPQKRFAHVLGVGSAPMEMNWPRYWHTVTVSASLNLRMGSKARC